MNNNVPSFMRGMGETPDDNEVMNVLNEEPEEKGAQLEASLANKGVEQDDNATEDTANQDNTAVDAKEGEGLPDANTAKEGEDAQSTDANASTENKQENTEGDKKGTEEQLILGKFKNMEELQTHLDTLEKAVGNMEKQIETPDAEFEKKLNVMLSKPMIDVVIPKPEDYYLQDGSFDIGHYMNDTLTHLVMQLQHSMFQGKLGAAQVGLLKQSIRAEHQSTLSQVEKAQKGEQMWSQVTKAFPILAQKPEMADEFYERMRGAYAVMTERAQKEGKKIPTVQELGYDFYEGIAKKMFGANSSAQASVQQKVDPVEKQRGVPPLTPKNTGSRDEMDDVIEGMMNTKRKSLF